MSYPLPTLNAMEASDMAGWHGLDAEEGEPWDVREAPLRLRCIDGDRNRAGC
jgi:hypothetical protein